jgi:hypothetical protein
MENMPATNASYFVWRDRSVVDVLEDVRKSLEDLHGRLKQARDGLQAAGEQTTRVDKDLELVAKSMQSIVGQFTHPFPPPRFCIPQDALDGRGLTPDPQP